MEHEPDDESHLLHSTRLPPAPAAALRTPAAGSRASGDDLREALDQLRAELAADRPVLAADAPSPAARPSSAAPVTPGGPPGKDAVGRGRRLALRAAAAVVALVACAGLVRVVAWSASGSPSATPRPRASASSVPPSPAPSGQAPGPAPTDPAPAVTLPPGLPAGGPGADAPGAELSATLGATDVVEVYERLVVRPGTGSVLLTAAPTGGLAGELSAARPAVAGLEVAADGRRVPAVPDGDGWRVTAPAGATLTRLVVRYRVTGALVAADPAPPGRRTLVLRPLTGAAAGGAGDPVLVRLDDARVGAVYCPAAPSPLCATSAGTVHVASVPPGTPPLVLAQVTRR